MRNCTVLIRDEDGETQMAAVKASSLFGAIDQAMVGSVAVGLSVGMSS